MSRRLLGEGLLALHVVLLEVVAILAAAHIIQPLLIVAIPRDRVRQTLIELHLRLPSELAAQLFAVDGIAQIMSRTIGDELDQTFGSAQRFQDQLGNFEILHLAAAADVVHLAFAALLQYHVQSGAMIVDVDPVANIAALAVHRQALARHRLRDHQRNKFLRKLIRPVVIRAARNQPGKLMGAHVGQHQKVGRRFGRGVGTVGLQRRVF